MGTLTAETPCGKVEERERQRALARGGGLELTALLFALAPVQSMRELSLRSTPLPAWVGQLPAGPAARRGCGAVPRRSSCEGGSCKHARTQRPGILALPARAQQWAQPARLPASRRNALRHGCRAPLGRCASGPPSGRPACAATPLCFELHVAWALCHSLQWQAAQMMWCGSARAALLLHQGSCRRRRCQVLRAASRARRRPR